MADAASFVDTEVSFRPLPEFELWVADVAYLSREGFAEVDPEDNIRGAPALVIEVLSPSSTVDEEITGNESAWRMARRSFG